LKERRCKWKSARVAKRFKFFTMLPDDFLLDRFMKAATIGFLWTKGFV
jgi:hypothetical protein